MHHGLFGGVFGAYRLQGLGRIYDVARCSGARGFRSGILHMGGCQNYGASLGPYYNTAPSI